MPRLAVAMLLLLCAAPALGQAPYLVSDLNTSYVPSAVSSNPQGFVAVGPYVYFSGTTDAAGTELFRTDGTTIELVKDVNPGPSGSSAANVVPLAGNTFVFTACDADHGCELWFSDGTPEGTSLVKDIAPGVGSSGAKPMAQLGGKVFLLANSSGGTFSSTWVTDGTTAGTVQLTATPGYYGFQLFDGAMYFASSSTLWRSDGTVGGTIAVRTGMPIRGLTVAGGRLMFAAEDFYYGYELWTSDGTTAGTMLVKDINPGGAGSLNTSLPISLARVGEFVVFFAYEPASGWSLWRSDGTVSGTMIVTTFSTSNVSPPAITSAGNLAYFSRDGLWRTDGTPSGTFTLGSAIDVSAIAVGPAAVYFFARTSTTGYGLWSSNGTDAGTAQLSTAVVSGTPSAMAWTGGKLYFSGNGGSSGAEPWISDGTGAGTVRLANMMADPPASSNPANLRAVAGKLFFTASTPSRKLYVTDGTSAGTIDLTGGTSWRYDNYTVFVPWRSELVFTATYSQSELWRTDGTVAGTALFVPMRVSSVFGSSGYLYFRDAASYSSNLQRTDGTTAGTIGLGVSEAHNLLELGGKVYFEAGSTAGIWRTEGTPATTLRLTTYSSNSGADSMIATGSSLYYTGSDAVRGRELWRTDVGSLATTVLDVLPGTASSYPASLTAVRDLVFFTATSATTGQEIWRTDGTAAGTLLLRDVEPGIKSGYPSALTAAHNMLFFAATTTLDGRELWKSDGTVAGTSLVANIASGAASSGPEGLVAADGFVWFAADDRVTGMELWKSDGTAAGTRLVADLMPGSLGSWPRSLTVSGRKLYFTAETAAGRELWALDLAATTYLAGDANVVEGDAGTSQLRFVISRKGDLSLPGSVAYTTVDGTATAGSDYVARSGTASFAAGVAEVAVSVDVTGDTVVEGSELFWLAISSPVNGIIEGSRGFGSIEDDDQTVELSITHVLSGSSQWSFVVRNDGTTQALGVAVRVSESPTHTSISGQSGSDCVAEGHGLLKCGIGTLEPGQSRTITMNRGSDYYYGDRRTYFDPDFKPGFTVTAAVSSALREGNSANNGVAYMIDGSGRLRVPPALISGSSAAGTYMMAEASTAQRLMHIVSSNAAVTVDPSPLTIPPGERISTFVLNVGSATGSTMLSGDTASMRVPIVQAGVEALLDVALIATLPWDVDYGKDINIPVRVAARRPDGTYPTGRVQLLDQGGAVVAEKSIDATGSTTLTVSDAKVGTHVYRLRYEGDAFFNPLTVTLSSVRVSPIRTSLWAVMPQVTCAKTVEVVVTVKSYYTSTLVPTGVVKVAGAPVISGVLVPNGAVGEASVTLQVPVGTTTTSISFEYVPEGPFASDWEYAYITVGCSTISLSATAASPAQVALSWTSTGATTYDIYRNDGWSYVFLGYATTNSYLDLTVTPGKAYLYRVRPTGSTLFSPPDLATTVMFDDDPIVPGLTAVRMVHFTQLTAATKAVRGTLGLSIDVFKATPLAGNPITPHAIAEIRSLLVAARRRAGLPEVVFTDPTITPGMPIKAVHVQELRNATK